MKNTFYTIPGCPVFFALLADLHNKPFDAIVDSLRINQPEMIAVAGDVIYGTMASDGLMTEKQQNVLPFLKACVEIAPTFFSLGNHEMLLCDEDLANISATGVTLLDNQYTIFQTGSQKSRPVQIGGLTSGYVLSYRRYRNSLHTAERYPEFQYAEIAKTITPDISWLSSFAAAPGYHILLSHHPEYISLIPGNIELVCSGHAHGGQWNYYSFREHRPRGIFAPGQGLFPKYTSGIYEGRMIVSRGLSNTTWIPRFFNPTEIVYIR